MAFVRDGAVAIERLDPASLGIPNAPPEAIRAESVEDAAAMIRGVLAGDRGPARDIVRLNAATAMVVAGAYATIESALPSVDEAIDRGRAEKTLAELARVSKS